ncbi:MAG TPA: ABC transporter permease subunit [Actinomycetes bacterium]|jgi:NitT/TauT family transport system permease protein|nr:ABC transporter permease subunit [Actinomycetes bacterium]
MRVETREAQRQNGSRPRRLPRRTRQAAPPPRAGVRRLLGLWVPPLGVLAVVLGLWYGVSYVLLTPDRRFLAPPPHQVVQIGFLIHENLVEIMRALLLSTEVALLGLALAALLGMGSAILMHQARWIERSLYPYAVILQTIPILALVPLLGFWFGFGFFSRVLVCVLIAVFPIIANTLFGLQSVEPRQHDLFTLHTAGRLTRLWKLELPAALPSIFTGLRIGAGASVIGAIVGDFFFQQGPPGIGSLIGQYSARLQSEQLFGSVFASSMLGVVVFWIFGLLGRRVVGRWHESGRDPRGTALTTTRAASINTQEEGGS